MERYSLKRANLELQKNPRKISVIEKFEEKFQMGFRFYWAAVCNPVFLLTTNPDNIKMFKVSNRNTRKRCDIKSIKNTRKSNSLFAGNNCPEPCPGQLFLEYTPICVQKSAFSYE